MLLDKLVRVAEELGGKEGALYRPRCEPCTSNQSAQRRLSLSSSAEIDGVNVAARPISFLDAIFIWTLVTLHCSAQVFETEPSLRQLVEQSIPP